jgi:hypothetical protein
MRTRQSLSDLIEGRLSSPDGRSELVKLATRLIVEERLEAESREAVGRDYYAHGALAGQGYRNGTRTGRLKTAEGFVDSRAMDLAGLGEEGVEYGPTRRWVLEKIAWIFHNTERANREITALAAFRLARAAGQDFEQAVKTAGDVTWKAHFDYSSSNRPRLLQSDVARVPAFSAFQINMLYRLGRDFHQMFKGESPQARKEARIQFAGIMGMMALHAGALGIPFMGTAMWIIDILRGLFGDDDPRSTAPRAHRHADHVVPGRRPRPGPRTVVA